MDFRTTTLSLALPLTLAAALALPAEAQTSDDLKPQPMSAAGTISQVTLYRGRAAVTRHIHKDIAQGVWAVRIAGLPATVQANSIQAKVAAGGASGSATPKLLGVEYAETPLADFGGTPEGVALQTKLTELQRKMEYLKQDDAQLDQQAKLVEQVGVRATANATNDGGTQALNLDSVVKQLEFVGKERMRIVEAKRALVVAAEDLARQIEATQKELADKGGANRVERAAVVLLAVPTDMPVNVDLTYVVTQATWEPVYNIRAAGDRTGVEIEYDAMITQSTGEDWKDVKLSLSTAQPTRASAPPPVNPWFVDIYVPPPPAAPAAPPAPMRDASAGRPAETAEMGLAMKAGAPAMRRAEIEAMSRGANVQETGVAVAFDLPRTLTIPTDSAKKQRTHIASVQPTASFVYTAQPIVTEDVFLRGDLTNSSAYQLLPGRAQIFMGGDFIGETAMPSVAPKDEFKVFFGPDRALKAKRQLAAKTTGSAGLFGGSQSTTWNYRVTIDNSTGKPATVELFDRRPVSRNEKIVAAVSNLSLPLSTNKAYVENQQPQGILRWDLTVPATARGDQAMPITWTVEVTRPNNVQTTPLPPD